jgi:hypothetical protein
MFYFNYATYLVLLTHSTVMEVLDQPIVMIHFDNVDEKYMKYQK